MRLVRTAVMLAATALAVGACASSATTTAAPSPGAGIAVPSSAAAPVTGAQAETVFLAVTAAHLCAAQSRVYTDPSALAQAYATSSQYTGLTDTTVSSLQQRLGTDPAFATRLADEVRSTCGGTPAPNPS
jgi:hypothetical protein